MATKLKVQVAADTTGFNAALTRVQMRAQAFASKMRSETNRIAQKFGGIFSVAAAGLAIRRTIEWADTIADASRRLDVNVEKLQAWEYAATQTGSSLSALTNTIEKLKKSQADASRGLSTAQIGLGALGIGQADDVDTMLNKLAALAQGGRLGGLTGPLKDVAGRGATELIPALKQWQELSMEAERVGVIMREEQVQVLEKVKDQFTFMGRFMMATLAPAIQFVTEKMIMFAAVVKGVAAAAGSISVDLKGAAKRTGGIIDKILSGNLKGAVAETLFGNASNAIAGNKSNDPLASLFDELEKARKKIAEMRTGIDNSPAITEDLSGFLPGRRSPVKAQVDSLAKVGLFTASGLNAQPVLDMQRRMVRHLQNIDRNTAQNDGGFL